MGDPGPIRTLFAEALEQSGRNWKMYCAFPAMHFEKIEGFPDDGCFLHNGYTDVRRRCGARPLLLGPGSIHVAHTSEERISKQDLEQAVDQYSEPSAPAPGEMLVSPIMKKKVA